MIEIADSAGIKLAVHQNYRWMKMNFLAHHIIAKGLIGEPFFADVEILGTQDVDLAGHPFYSKCTDFLTIQWDNHLADLLRYWTDRSAHKVLARTSRMNGQDFTSDNWLAVIADFGDGLTGHILHTELLRSSLGGTRCRVDGSEGSVVFDFHDNLLLESKVLGKGVREIKGSDLSFPSSWCGAMGDLLISIEEDREPLVSARRNLPTIRTILAEDQSARSGGIWTTCEGNGC
jgi:predicted dehydrogenase